jgi:hypothetical protein
MSASQFACRLQLPLPVIIATLVPEIVQEPEAVMVAMAVEFVVAVTVNCAPYAADAGAPVKLTVGVALVIVTAIFPLLPVKVPVGV